MESMTFDEMTDRTMELFGQGAYREALAWIDENAAQFPDQHYWLHYMRACSSARLDDLDGAVGWLEKAEEEGLWYSRAVMRESPSFQPLQGHAQFEAQVERFAAAEEQAREEARLFVRQPDDLRDGEARPVLMALHGNGENGQHALTAWGPIVEQGWVLAVPQSSQARGAGIHVWDDRARALEEIREHYRQLDEQVALDPDQFVIAGFSMGGETALWIALDQVLPTRGFVVVGPGGPTMDNPAPWEPLLDAAAARGLRGYVVLGDADTTVPHDEIEGLVERFNQAGIACGFERIPGLAHRFPANFDQILGRALAFVAGSQDAHSLESPSPALY